jgi:SPP1 family phage portal protein
MNLDTLTSGLANPATLIPAILKERRAMYEQDAFKQYEPEGHKIYSKVERPDKWKWMPSPDGDIDPETGKVRDILRLEKVARIALALQKIIVTRATAFATGGDTILTADMPEQKQQDLFKAVSDTWKKNKLRYKNGPLFTATVSQLEAAEIWYSEIEKDGNGKVKAARMRSRFYFPADGWELLPVFDNAGDMIAFGLKYKEAATEKTFLELYTKDHLRKYVYDTRGGVGWAMYDEVKLVYGKIPVIYYSVPKSEWADVQTLIERLEKLMSVYADTNDYNGSPILGLFGNVVSLPQKGEAGKAIEFEKDADARYITWEGKPEAIISEHDMLLRFIYTLTQTPDLSFEAMRGLGDISGIAFKRMLIDAHLKAKRAQDGWYGEGIQRRLNFLVAACSEANPGLEGVELDINPKFSLYNIDDEAERIENALKANGGKPVISHEESIAQAGLTDDAAATFEKIQEEEKFAPKKEGANTIPVPAAA